MTDCIKQRLLAMILIVVAWSGLNYLFHHVILLADYQATASLWRSMADMRMGLMNLKTVLTAIIFVFIYCRFVRPKSCSNGIRFGLAVGLLQGIPMGLGSFSYMPITEKIAIVWLISAVVSYIVAGAIVGKIVTTESDCGK